MPTDKLRAALGVSPQSLTLTAYQGLAEQTDLTARGTRRDLTIPLLGLFGEVGSLLSEVKKKQRERESYVRYEDSVVEELGDVLWYITALASRRATKLDDIARIAFPALASVRRNIRFSSLQRRHRGLRKKSAFGWEDTLIKLGSNVGSLMTVFTQADTSSKDITRNLTSVLKTVVTAATMADVSLAVAAQRNLSKIFDRWPLRRAYPSLFDEDYDEDERLPRQIEIEIIERNLRGKTYVLQRCNGINIGDRLTDNRLEHDDYRFHDVFHLANAAILGWSPVIRALFRVKRKSRPAIDETEDGARAILIEEGISTWLFNQAVQLNYFEGFTALTYDLLKAIRNLVKGYEVEVCPLWLWEESILQGYNVFRDLRKHRAGRVIADLKARKLTFLRLT